MLQEEEIELLIVFGSPVNEATSIGTITISTSITFLRLAPIGVKGANEWLLLFPMGRGVKGVRDWSAQGDLQEYLSTRKIKQIITWH